GVGAVVAAAAADLDNLGGADGVGRADGAAERTLGLLHSVGAGVVPEGEVLHGLAALAAVGLPPLLQLSRHSERPETVQIGPNRPAPPHSRSNEHDSFCHPAST